MTPNEEQSLARIVGRVEGKLDAIGSQVQQITRIVEGKASAVQVEDLAKRVDGIESNQDKRWGRDSFIKGGFGAAVAIGTLLIAGGVHF